jgi:peptidyl-prolyl cis-trans isomerase C
MNKPLFPDVIVNGQSIPSSEIAAEAQNHSAPAGKPGFAWRSAAKALTVRALLLQEAEKLALKAEPQEVSRGKTETEPEALIRQVLELKLDPLEPTAQAVREVYDADNNRFRAPSLFEPAHILFVAPPKDPKARAAAKLRATAALAALQEKPGAFHQLAMDQSDCSSRSAGGRLGQISTGDTVPEFEAALSKLEAGETCAEPVESRYGFHVVRLEAKSIGEVLPFEAVKGGISEALEKSAWAECARDYVDALIAKSEIAGIDMTK